MQKVEQNALRLIIILLFAACLALRWDIYRHITEGRETVWSPPHILFYVIITLASVLSVYMWLLHRGKWRNVAIAFLLLPIFASIDALLHLRFGDSTLAFSNINPGHIGLAINGAFIAGFLFQMIKDHTEVTELYFFRGMLFGIIMNALFHPVSGFLPLGGEHYIDFWGAGIVAAYIVMVCVLAQKYIKGFAPATLVIIFFLVIASAGFGGNVPGVIYKPYNINPSYLVPYSYLLAAALADLLQRYPYWVRGYAVGLSYSLLVYHISHFYIKAEYMYSYTEEAIAIGSSIVGGIAMGLILQYLPKFSHLIHYES